MVETTRAAHQIADGTGCEHAAVCIQGIDVEVLGQAHDAALAQPLKCTAVALAAYLGIARDTPYGLLAILGFIGTKLSAHLKKCSECHDEQAEQLASGPHHWDFSKKINTNYPSCVDCHGNHDISNPPEDFKLKAVCLDCHETFDQDQPHLASIVDKNDALWQTLHKIRLANRGAGGAAPEKLQPEIDRLRHETMLLIHGSKEVSAEAANKLNGEVEALRVKLEASLQK